jgi:DNA-directed RNA polymerase subunit K/omega
MSVEPVDSDADPSEPTPTPPEEPVEPAPPIESRFLFVDVAAQRAKQLRRGALPRLPELKAEAPERPRPDRLFKLERIAMEEVNRGLVHYTLPDETGQPEGTS